MNITQFLTPAACYQIKKFSNTTEGESLNFGYRIIEIKKDNISTEVIMFDHDEFYTNARIEKMD